VRLKLPGFTVVTLLALAGCARHPLPQIDLGDENGSGSALHGKDAGSQHTDPDMEDPDNQPDPNDPPAGDGDSTGDGDGDGDALPDPGNTGAPDAGSHNSNARDPAPTNASGCPQKAPNKIEFTPCIKDQAIQCSYGAAPDYKDYVCNCYVATWVCN